MWRVVLAAVVCVACGRIGFDARARDDTDAGDAADAPGPGFRALVAYANQTCALFGDKAFCWGENADHQLGDATADNRKAPVQVLLPAGSITSISQGEGHACATVDGAVHCWGRAFADRPTKIQLPATDAATKVSCGRDFTCAIAGEIYCWGNNEAGQLGDLSTTTRSDPGEINSTLEDWRDIRAGDDHVCAVSAGAGPHCWGHNDEGAMGTGSFSPDNVLTPGPVAAPISSLPLIAGWSACSLEAGEVFCWGRNEEGELGNATQVPNANPKTVPNLANVTAIAHGGGPTDFDASCAITDGKVRCWGSGAKGRLGNGSAGNSLVPVAVATLPAPAVELAIGYDHACALVEGGDIYCWGGGDQGQLGDGTGTSSLTPVRVIPPGS